MTIPPVEADLPPLPLPAPHSWRGRFLYVLVCVLLPVGCFLASPWLRPEWQNGQFNAYVTLLLDPQAALGFFPFLIYADVCLLIWLAAPERFAPRFWVRFGIYTGVLLALQYAILVALSFEWLGWCAEAFFFGLVYLHQWLKTKFKQRGAQFFGLLLLLAGLAWTGFSFWRGLAWEALSVTDLLRSLGNALSSLPLLSLGISLLLTPCFCLLVFGSTALKLLKTSETHLLRPLPRSLGWLAWLAGLTSAWRWSILKMFEIYASLPPQPPDCYIATAAARGHQSFVRSQVVTLANRPLWVNPQLQTLKCAELALLALAPELHRPLRRFYDLAGKALARRLTNPWLADLAYLTLKPFEWLAKGILCWLAPDWQKEARKIYKA